MEEKILMYKVTLIYLTIKLNFTLIIIVDCGRQEEPAILISRLLLYMHCTKRMQFDRARFDLLLLIICSHILTICHVKLTESMYVHSNGAKVF